MTLVPKRPLHLSPLADACLQALAGQGWGRRISIGGAVGLLHFLDYRSTSDLDAWWSEEATALERREVEALIDSTLRAFGEVKIRRWGDVVSIELIQGTKKVFSFQIAQRSSRLQPPEQLGWLPVAIDTFEDLIASKMVALVERGAPRDFRDIFSICRANLARPAECWRLWRQKMTLEDRDATRERGLLALATHLKRLERLRPIGQIADEKDKLDAQDVRSFFAEVFPNALVD